MALTATGLRALIRRAQAAGVALAIGAAAASASDDGYRYQSDFPPDELAERRSRVLDAIGGDAIALLQGAAVGAGFVAFRQSNSFYYLTGLEVPHAYLLLDGTSRQATLFLPHRDARRERGEGPMLSAEDAERLIALTGVHAVQGLDQLGRALYRPALRSPPLTLYTPLSPAEGAAQSRDELLIAQGAWIADPWDGRASREGRFLALLRERYPQLGVADLSPTLDRLRSVKSPREIALIRRASQIAGLGILEAIRSTSPGAMEYQLDAAARYVFQVNGARGEGYRSITAGGTNAYHGHYYRNDRPLREGDLVLMDYAPDYRYYTSDVARMWPVSGRFDAAQRALYGFIARYSEALMRRIRPGVSAETILGEAAAEMAGVLEQTRFSRPAHEQAAREALTFRGHLSHPVGLAVHDVGGYGDAPLVPGQVFSVDPMLWVHEERLYVRMEDVVVVTADGVENFTAFLPRTPEQLERAMAEPGVLQLRPPSSAER